MYAAWERRGSDGVGEPERGVAAPGSQVVAHDAVTMCGRRWQKFSTLSLSEETLAELAASCDEFLVGVGYWGRVWGGEHRLGEGRAQQGRRKWAGAGVMRRCRCPLPSARCPPAWLPSSRVAPPSHLMCTGPSPAPPSCCAGSRCGCGGHAAGHRRGAGKRPGRWRGAGERMKGKGRGEKGGRNGKQGGGSGRSAGVGVEGCRDLRGTIRARVSKSVAT